MRGRKLRLVVVIRGTVGMGSRRNKESRRRESEGK